MTTSRTRKPRQAAKPETTPATSLKTERRQPITVPVPGHVLQGLTEPYAMRVEGDCLDPIR